MVDIKELEPIGGTISVVNVPVAMLTASNMPMRDCMAMAAMTTMFYPAIRESIRTDEDLDCLEVAGFAYQMADAMLAAREQK